MSLNISPETKVGRITNWDTNRHMKSEIEKYHVLVQDEELLLDKVQFKVFMDQFKFSISSNGILYSTERVGVLPEILDKWFNERLEFKKLVKKYKNEGNDILASYYNQRQHIQKIFLNSIYGVVGLPIFRFYDVDNALAVTATGQDILKTSGLLVQKYYEKCVSNSENKDFVIYQDTDSCYSSAISLMPATLGEDEKKMFAVKLAKQMEMYLNTSYDAMAKKLFFISKHRFYIKGEAVAKTGFWTTKKRYALLKVYDLESDRNVESVTIKGLDVVRSSFPPAFSSFMLEVLENILQNHTKKQMDDKIQNFHKSLTTIDYLDIAKNTAVKEASKYDESGNVSLLKFKKGTPAHVRSALIYNRFLVSKNLHKKHLLIRDGDKIKWVYLRSNPLQIDMIGFKGYDDPKIVVEFIKKYIDGEKIFNLELKGKLEDFYKSLGWGPIPTQVNQAASEFFTL